MLIRDCYIKSFNEIEGKIEGRYGTSISRNHIIPKNASIEEVIGYTRRFIVESGEEHFRYDYYRDILAKALTRFRFNATKNKIAHLDLGCGPGLFSWVVQDYLLSKYKMKPGNIDLIGYDHAKKMIRLAKLFKEYLPVEYNFEGYFELDKILNLLESRDFSDYDCIITFGHVLIQVGDNTEALQDFVELVQNLFPSNSCILLAVDAYANETKRQDFRSACKKLMVALSNAGVAVNNKRTGPERSYMCARLSHER